MNYLFLPAIITDVDHLAALEIELFKTNRCSRRSFRYLIRRTHVIVIKQEDSLEIVGYAILLGRNNSRKMRIYSFGIAKKARGQGLASKLLIILETIARSNNCSMLTLEVNDINVAAIDLYTNFGFKQFDFRLGYYEDGGHAILMRKMLR